MRALLPFDIPPPPLDWLPDTATGDEEAESNRIFSVQRATLQRLAHLCQRLQSTDDRVERFPSAQLGPLLRDIQWLEQAVSQAMRSHVGLDCEIRGRGIP